MINFRRRRRRFKKKIAELLSRVLAESAEFAAKYVECVKRSSASGGRDFDTRVARDFALEAARYGDGGFPGGPSDSPLGAPDFQDGAYSPSQGVLPHIYEEGSQEFSDAVAKLPKELLRLMRTQFHSEPSKFVLGGIRKEELEDGEENLSSDEEYSQLNGPDDIDGDGDEAE